MSVLREWLRRVMRRGAHRDGIRPARVLWMVRARDIRAARIYPARAAARPPLRITIATQRMPARARFATAVRPVQQRAAAAVSTAVAVGSHIARRAGAHRLTADTAEHHDLVKKIVKRQQREERKLARQRARGELSLFASRPREGFAWQ